MTFNYIRNQIFKFKKVDLLERCYLELSRKEDNVSAVWFTFLIMKWTYLYGEKNYEHNTLTEKDFYKIYNAVSKFNEEHVIAFMKAGRVDKAFQVLHSQQFYLQKTVFKETFATQLKLYTTLSHKYDINLSFKNKTGLSISDLIFFLQTIWIIFNANKIGETTILYNGFINNEHIEALIHYKGIELTKKFIELLTLNPAIAIETIKKNNFGLRNEELQSLERTFFTMYPFQLYKDSQIKIIHKSVFYHTINYFIYDYMKANDSSFSEEFGRRFEKYIECGIKEMGISYKNEAELKKVLPENSKLVDFYISDENILIECKAIELQIYPSINPTDELIYNALKDSIIKAYTKQMLQVANQLNNSVEYFGVILTYKELYYSRFTELWEISKKDILSTINSSILPPENVFIIDYLTWDKMVQLVKDKKATLLGILKKAKSNNSKPETLKQMFVAHLDDYDLKHFDLNYLKEELKSLDVYK